MQCQLCGRSDVAYLIKTGDFNFSCGHCVCWFCSTQHCNICITYQLVKGYPDGRLIDNWPIKEAGCVICNSKETFPCGTRYADCANITPPH